MPQLACTEIEWLLQYKPCLIGEALTNPRELLPLSVGSIHGSLIEEEMKVIITKTPASSRSGRPVGFRERKLDALEALLDHNDRMLELGKEETKDDLAEVNEAAEVALNIGVKL